MIRIWSFLAAILFAGPLFAQEVKFKDHKVEGETVIFTYDLTGVVPGQTFEVKISIKINGEERELREVTGEVGRNIREGKDKKIVWNAKKEMSDFSGELRPIIAATVLFSPLAKAEITGGNSLKRGKTYILTWAGGVKNQPVNIELVKGNRTIATLKNNLPNSGQMNVTIPKNLKSGADYRLRVLHVLNPTNKSETEVLKISRAFPLGVTIVGVAAITGAVVYYLLFSGDDQPPDDPVGPTSLPDAPVRPPDG